MIDARNINTIFALRELFDIARKRSKPLLIWVGAGASSWCNYPRWPELAEKFHSQFSRIERTYDSRKAFDLLSAERFPEFFQVCKDANPQRFASLLVSNFSPQTPSPVYQRFVTSLQRLPLQFIVTTNVDELLERSLPTLSTVSRTDLQHALELQRDSKSFVCKLHGSISEVSSTVFTSQDYSLLYEDSNFLQMLERLLAMSVIVFVGYSLQDDYVLSMIARNADINALFGDGPHFAILPKDHPNIPVSIRTIHYIPEPHKDHRSSITIIEEIGLLAKAQLDENTQEQQASPPTGLYSAHLLFHILPPGTHNTSHTLGLTDNKQMIVGTGFSNEELPGSISTSMHDILVGLMCFDKLYAPVHSIARVHDLIGATLFWELVHNHVLFFVNWERIEGIIFPNSEAIAGGHLVSFAVSNPDKTPQTVKQIIRERFVPIPGREQEAEQQLTCLEDSTTTISETQEGDISRIAHSLLLRPSIRRLLGVSEGTPLDSLTRWGIFPILRLAHVTKIGAACRVLRISSAKLDFGTAELAGPAFACAIGSEWADATASYVLSGSFSADLGAAAIHDAAILRAVLRFRESQQGENLRREVFARLLASESAEVSVAINAALKSAVPPAAIQKARDNFVSLFAPSTLQGKLPPAIWNDRSYCENALIRWRYRSATILKEWCKTHGINQYSLCPCGSGERFKFCCKEALINPDT